MNTGYQWAGKAGNLSQLLKMEALEVQEATVAGAVPLPDAKPVSSVILCIFCQSYNLWSGT